MPTYKLEVVCATEEELQGVVNKLSGVEALAAAAPAADKPKKTKPKEKAAAATREAFEDDAEAEAPAAPAPKKGKAKKEPPTVAELKKHILALAGSGPDASDQVKEFVKQYGVTNLSAMDDDTRAQAFADAEAYFASEDEGSDDEDYDPMG